MYLPEHPAPTPPERYVSTGHLPVDGVVARLLEQAHALYGANADGELSGVYPVLAQADPARFGLAVATVLTLFFVPALYAAWYRVPRGGVGG